MDAILINLSHTNMNEMVITYFFKKIHCIKKGISYFVLKKYDLYPTFQEHIYCIKQREAHLGPCLCISAAVSPSLWSLVF